MVRLIYKFPLVGRLDSFHMPVRSRVIKFGFQNGSPVIWAIFKKEDLETTERRTFKLVFTGEEFEEEGFTYIGTDTGKNQLVYHCFVDKQ